MKNKKFPGLLGTIIVGMAFSLALAGCDTGNDGPSAAELAAQLAVGQVAAASQLAAGLNEIEADSATVDGATVTLSKYLSIESQFTVPAGVTLDLTGDGELALLDATLTVNGTVKAGPERVRMKTAAKEATIKGSGTIQLKGKGHLLVIQGSEGVANRTLTLEGVTLAGVADNNDPLVVARSGGDKGSGRTGHFIMKSGTITGNTHIRSGSDDDNNWAGAGGVRVNEGGMFTMEGGTISGNTAKGSRGSGGGGVRVEDGGTFIMRGGVISGNIAESANWSEGGGVGVWRGTFTMEGGVISGNTVKGDRGCNGGGVDIGENSTFTLKGGTIYGDTYGLPAGADQSFANIARGGHVALYVHGDAEAANWGTGGAYTKGGVSQTGGSKIVPFSKEDGQSAGTSDTLIAKPAP
jgi:hypothetical protein